MARGCLAGVLNMDITPKRIAPLAGKGEEKKLHSNNNSAQAQRQRLLDALRKSPVSTIAARRDLDIMMPAARVHELRHRYGLEIDLVWVNEPTDCGRVHRVGQYVLRPESRVSHG